MHFSLADSSEQCTSFQKALQSPDKSVIFSCVTYWTGIFQPEDCLMGRGQYFPCSILQNITKELIRQHAKDLAHYRHIRSVFLGYIITALLKFCLFPWTVFYWLRQSFVLPQHEIIIKGWVLQMSKMSLKWKEKMA